jgi:hypothetical protein
MVNNENIIPKTETVYEIKNEIPSYEEFLKNYENDGKVNYDDLNSGEVGESKGYGPCSRSDCNCSVDITLYLVKDFDHIGEIELSESMTCFYTSNKQLLTSEGN